MNLWSYFKLKRDEAQNDYDNQEQPPIKSSGNMEVKCSANGDCEENARSLESRPGSPDLDLSGLDNGPGVEQTVSPVRVEYKNGGNTGIQASSSGDDDGIFSFIGPTESAIACGCLAGVIFIGLLTFLWIKNRRKRQKLLRDLTLDGYDEGGITKSAPTSRCPSPRSAKRMSCPEAIPARQSPKPGTVLVKSWTCDPILDSTLPPECVQPKAVVENIPASYQQMGEDHPPAPSAGPSTPSSSSHRGKIWFSTFYDANAEKLNVNLIMAKDLPKRKTTNEEPDPFVKMYLLPDDKTCQVSTSKKNTQSPVYNETHTFQVAQTDVKDRSLRFSVYDMDKRRVRRSLGHIIINLSNLDLTEGQSVCSELETNVQSSASLGDVQLSLAYIPAKEKVKIGIHKARKLQLDNDYFEKGSYVRMQLYYGHKCHRTKRTVTRPMGENCSFDESLSFTIQGRQLESCSLVLSVMITHPGTLSKSDVEYGRVVIGPFMYARGEELAHWQEMVSRPKNITTRWHSLGNPAQP